MEVITGGRGAPAPQKKPNLLIRLLAFLLTLALVLGAVALVACRERLNFDAVRRWYTYRDLERAENGQADSFRFDGNPSDPCVSLGGDLLTCSAGAGIRLFSGSGVSYINRPATMSQPAVSAAGKYGIVYDAGGRDLCLYTERTEVFSLSLEQGQTLISAGVNQHGWLAVVRQESGCKGAVTVYNGSHRAAMEVRLSSRFVLDAVPAPDNRSAAVLTVGLSGGAFDCRVDLYRLDRESGGDEPDWSCSLGNNMALGLRWDGDGIWVLGESALSLVSPDGELTGSCSYDGSYLKAFSLEGDGAAALLLSKYRSGTGTQLLTVSPDGQVRASLEPEGQVLSLSAAGRYVAVLTSGRLDIYDLDLELYASLDIQGARQVVQRSDGTALLLGTGSAQLFVPS